MAWTRKLASGRYQGLYRDADGTVRTVRGGPWPHKAHALRLAGEAEADSRKAGWRDPSAGLITWGAWCADWWPTRIVEGSTLASDVGRRDVHLMPQWSAVPLVDITRHDIRAWAAKLRATGLAPATVQRIVHLLSASLSAAVDAEVIAANPAARLKLGGGAPTVERYISHDDVDRVLEHLDGEYRAMALLLVGTGLRWGEAAGLHWSRVDRERGVLVVADVWSQRDRAMKAYPKGRRARQVPLPDWLELGEPTAGPCGYEHRGCRSGLVVSTGRGAVVDSSRFRTRWDSASAAAGLGHVRPHDLRHTYASWLLQGGTSLAEVGQLLGHESPITTQRYARLAEVRSEAVLAALGRPERRAADVQQPAATRHPGGLHLVT